MTPQEAQMLQELVNKVRGTELTEKDHDAEALLKDGLARDPDALYKLAQTVLIQNMAIEQFQGQVQQLQEQVQQLQAEEDELRQQAAKPQPARATSFLGSLLGRRDPEPAPPQPQYNQAQYGQPQYQQVPPQYAAAPPAPGYGQGYAPAPGYGQGYAPAPSQGSSFLRSAATTAAGVAAGALAFEGIESLIHGGERGFGGGFGGGYGDRPVVEETVINNYNDDGDRYNERREQEASYDDRVSGPDEQPQGPYDGGAQDVSYDDSNFGTDDDNFGSDDSFGSDDNFA